MERLALTFDDGPDPRGTPAVLDALAAAGARATFFVLGERVVEHPALLRDTVAAGHDVELHGFAHLCHPDRGRATIAADLERALGALADAGVRPARWRVPWGVVAPFSAELAAAHGLALTGWTLDTRDWAGATAELIGPLVLAARERGLEPGPLTADWAVRPDEPAVDD
jgi:peptidoglycan/xylan/chitin deacetylase (PgdA/CDA1 family)